MKLICGIVLVFSLLMLRESVVLGAMIALLFAFAVWLALPLFDQLSEMLERETPWPTSSAGQYHSTRSL